MGDYNQIEGVYEVPVEGGTARSLFLRGRVTNRVKARYEDWLEAQARKRVFRLREELDLKEYQESQKAVATASGAGAFSWGGDAWKASLQQQPGMVKLIYLLAEDARQSHPEQKVTEADVLALLSDKKNSGDLGLAVQQILDTSPNFMSPPDRESPDS